MQSDKYTILFIIVAGLVFRLMMFDTQPVMEIDFYRYLWDGAVVSHGINPYQWSPDTVPLSGIESLVSLSHGAGHVFERINYPEFVTIYPPLAQIAFAIAYVIDPWSLDGFRWILLLAECTTLILILKVLHVLQRSKLWVAIYWLNPLVIKEIMNSGHMDGLLIPFVVLAIFAIVANRTILATVVIALAAAIKLWPLLLAPFVWSRINSVTTRLWHVVALSLFTIILLSPLLLTVVDDNSGLVGFSSQWVRNSAFFPALLAVINQFLNFGSIVESGAIARVTIAVIVVSTSFFLARKSQEQGSCIARITAVITLLFLLSPAQYPWYFVWIVPCLWATLKGAWK